MAELITSIEDLKANILTLEKYRLGDQRERQFYAKRIKNGKLFVALELSDGYLFAPSKFAGYKKMTWGTRATLTTVMAVKQTPR